MKKKSLNNDIVKGFVWNFISLTIHRSFDFIIKLVLARLLFPEQFGIVAMAAVFTTFIEVFTNLGFGAAIVQKKDSSLRQAHYHTAFWSGIIWSIILYTLVFFIVSPLAANFYNEPILSSIIPVLSIGILSNPINTIQKAILTRNLEFKKIALINNIAGIFSGLLALLLAYLGFGVWALVFNSVATFVIVMPLYFKSTTWVPKFVWEEEAFKDLFGFGLFTTGTSLVNNIASNVAILIIGRILTSALVGAYSLALMITSTFQTVLTRTINQIMYPVFGRLQDDKESIKNYYSKITLYNCILVFPFMGFFIVFNETFITVFFGNKWSMAIIPVLFLAISQLISTMCCSFSIVIRAIGKPSLEMKIESAITFFIFIPCIYVTTVNFGIVGASVAMIIVQIIKLIILQYYIKKFIDFSFYDLWGAVQKPISITLITIITSYIISIKLNMPFYVEFSIYFILYLLLFLLLFKKETVPVINGIKSMIKK